MMMEIKESAGYKKLISSVERDEHGGCKAHDYRGKLEWVLERAKHYEKKTGIPAYEILNAWEARRDYWYMNYYQDCNQPLIEGDNVRVFDDAESLRASIGEKKFRCPKCGGVSTNPYECDNSGECDWKSYGLFKALGKGAHVFVKQGMISAEIFMPISWE